MKEEMARLIFVFSACLMACAVVYGAPTDKVAYKLKYTENFTGRGLNPKLWKRIGSGHPDWCRNMSLREDLVIVTNGILTIRGIRNDGKDSGETRQFLTGGVMTKDLFAMRYGKIEFRLKLEDHQKGAWPAVWMMPQTEVKGWPNDGEIDIVERLNGDNFVYQTAHYGNGTSRDLSKGGRGGIKNGEWNIYALEWTDDEIAWFVNGAKTFSVKKENDNPMDYPWTTPFYLMIDMQLGGSWVGGVEGGTLPVAMHVDWVKFYQAVRNGKPISQFTR